MELRIDNSRSSAQRAEGNIGVTKTEDGFNVDLSRVLGNRFMVGLAAAITLAQVAHGQTFTRFESPSDVNANMKFNNLFATSGRGESIIKLTGLSDTDIKITSLEFAISRTPSALFTGPEFDDWTITLRTPTQLAAMQDVRQHAQLFDFGRASFSEPYGGALDQQGRAIELTKLNGLGNFEIVIPKDQVMYLGLSNDTFGSDATFTMMTDMRLSGVDDLGFFKASNTSAGVLNTISGWTGQHQNLAINVNYEPVPEPAGLAALSLGVAALAARRRVRKD